MGPLSTQKGQNIFCAIMLGFCSPESDFSRHYYEQGLLAGGKANMDLTTL